MIELLIEGSDINIETTLGATALDIAIDKKNPKVVEKLLSAGANINRCNIFGHTPLHLAIKLTPPNTEIIQLLLNAGADINAVDKEGVPILYWAIERYRFERPQDLRAKAVKKEVNNEYIKR